MKGKFLQNFTNFPETEKKIAHGNPSLNFYFTKLSIYTFSNKIHPPIKRMKE